MENDYAPGSMNDDMPDDEESASPATPDSSGSAKRVCVAALPDGGLWVYEESFSPPAQIPDEQVVHGNEEALRAVWSKLKTLTAGQNDDALMEAGFQANTRGGHA